MSARILIGTSGFSYEDWRGLWYPPEVTKPKMLDFYADVFDTLEVNATYYRTPGQKTAFSMIERARGRLTFVIKAPGDLTHKGYLNRETTEPWLRFLEPFQEADCLGATLFQFPNGFEFNDGNRRFLKAMTEELSNVKHVIEVRHSSWDDPSANQFLTDLQLSRSAVDQPQLKGLSGSGKTPLTGPIFYTRFHGRNAADWYGSEGMARYRYSYSESELQPWVPIIKQGAAEAGSAFVFFNNHPDASAPRNAEEFAVLLGEPLRGEGYKDLFS